MSTASPVMRRRLSVDARRAMLLELGLRLFGARGLDEVSVEDIAREAGVSAGLLYHYFGSKKEFHHEVTAHALGRLQAVTEPDRSLVPGERLVAGLVTYLEYLRDDPTGWSWLLRGGGSGDERAQAISEAYRESIEGWVFEALPPAARTRLARVAVRGWIGSNTEMVLVWLEDGEPPLVDVVRLMVAVLLAGLTEAGLPGDVVASLHDRAGVALGRLRDSRR